MYVTMNHIRTNAEEGAMLETRFANRARLVDAMPGFRSFELFCPAAFVAGHGDGGNEYNEYLIVTCWDDQASFDHWTRSQEHQRAHPGAAAGEAPSERRSWLTTHAPFETAYAAGWENAVAHAAEPIAVMNVVTIAPNFAPSFEAVFRSRERSVEEQPGFLSLEVLRPLSGSWTGPDTAPSITPDEAYLVLSRWASEEQHRAWTQSDDFRRAHSRNRLPEGAVVRSRVQAFRILHPAFAVQDTRTK